MADLIYKQAAIEAIKEDKIDLTHPTIVEVFKATGNFEKAETQVMTCDRHIKILKDLPSADAIEVVRCKDCKHYQFADNRAFGFPVKRCEWTGFEDIDNDDFCSRGERKDGEQNEID